jgi:hypothetical protein
MLLHDNNAFTSRLNYPYIARFVVIYVATCYTDSIMSTRMNGHEYGASIE